MSNVQNLIAAIRAMEDDDSVPESGYIHDGIDQEKPPQTYVEVDKLACGALITNEGGCDWDAINEMKKAGYPVTKGDGDSFGWLTGCIHTAKGVFVYG